MGYEAIGKVHRIGATERISDTFSKRELVVVLGADTKYPQTVAFEATKDRCDLLNDFAPGDDVCIQFDLRGREWTSPKGEVRCFVTLSIWKIERRGERRQTRTSQTRSKGAPAEPPPPADDDCPFASAEIAHEPSPIAKVLR